MRGRDLMCGVLLLIGALLSSGARAPDLYVESLKPVNPEEARTLKLSYQTGHQDRKFRGLEFSRDDRYLISSSWDFTTKIWDLATGLQLASLSRPAEARVRRDLKYLITHETDMMTSGYNSQKRFSVIDVERGQEVLMSTAAKSPDWNGGSPEWIGEWLAYGHRDDPKKESYFSFVEVPSGELKKELRFESTSVKLQDCGGDRFAIFATDRDKKEWLHWGDSRSLTWTRGRVLPTGDGVTKLTPDCKFLWRLDPRADSGTVEVEVFDAQTGQTVRKQRIPFPVPVGEQKFYWSAVRPNRLLPDGRHLLVIHATLQGQDGLWDLETGQQVASYQLGRVKTIALSHDGRLFAAAADDTTVHDIRVYETMTGTELRTLAPLLSPRTALAVSDDGRFFADGGEDGWVHVWDFRGAKLASAWYAGHRWTNPKAGTEHPGQVQALDFSPDGTRLATAGKDGLVRVWDLATRKELGVYKMGPVNDYGYWEAAKVFFSQDGKSLMALTDPIADAARRTVLSMVTVVKEEPVRGDAGVDYYQLSTSAFADVKLSPSRRWLAVPKWTAKTVEVYNLEAGQRELKFTVEGFGWPAIPVFTADEQHLVLFTHEKEGPAWVVELGTGKVVARQEVAGIYRTGWAVRDHRIVVADNSGAFKPWSVDPGLTTAKHQEWKSALLGVSEIKVHAGPITTFRTTPDGRFLLTASQDGTVRAWHTEDLREAAMFLSSGADGWVAATPEGYYAASREGTQRVAFRLGGQSYLFEQFDLRQNRPDLVLRALGYASPELIRGYEALYRKRLKKMGIAEADLTLAGLPELELVAPPPLSVKTRKLTLQVRAKTAQGALDRINAWVNDVPVFGRAGLPLRDQPQQHEGAVTLELLPGKNRIDLSVLTKSGLESLRRTVHVDLAAPAVKPDLYAILVGVSRYQDRQYDLQYAAKDAGDLGQLLKGEKKRFGAIRIVSLLDRQATQAKILATRKALLKSKPQDEVIVFVAGHGLLDDQLDYYLATADMDFAHPARLGVSFDALEGLFDGIPARRRVLLMDTCFSGEVEDATVATAPELAAGERQKVRAVAVRGLQVTRQLGGQPLTETLSATFADLRRSSGAVVISSAGGQEYAFESDRWNNGVFTYALLDGLKSGRADADRDGVVRASELREFVSQQVQELTAGRQTPTGRRGNLSWDFPVY